MAWDKQRALKQYQALMSQAEILWPPREVPESGGLTRIEQSNAVRILLDRKASLTAIGEKNMAMIRDWWKRFEATVNGLETEAVKKRPQWKQIRHIVGQMRSYLGVR